MAQRTASRLGDQNGLAYSYRNLGNAQMRLGEYDAAGLHVQRALDQLEAPPTA
jgi:hypothetical protein